MNPNEKSTIPISTLNKPEESIENWARFLKIKLFKHTLDPGLDPRYMPLDRPLKLDSKRLTVHGVLGWGSILTTHCADSGSWYFEVQIEPPDPNWKETRIRAWEGCRTLSQLLQMYPDLEKNLQPALRIGWGSRLMMLEAPVGSNLYGYGISSLDGKVVTKRSKSRKGGLGQPLRIGDVIGVYIHLPGDGCKAVIEDPRTKENLWPFLQRGLLADVTNDDTLPTSKPIPNSFIEYSHNGKKLGKAFTSIQATEYHPCISCFNFGAATINLGPIFQYPLPNSSKNSSPIQLDSFRPACEMPLPRYPCKEDLVKFLINDQSTSSTPIRTISKMGNAQPEFKFLE